MRHTGGADNHSFSGELDSRVGLSWHVHVVKEKRHPRIRFRVVRDKTTDNFYSQARRGGVFQQKSWHEGTTRRRELEYESLTAKEPSRVVMSRDQHDDNL